MCFMLDLAISWIWPNLCISSLFIQWVIQNYYLLQHSEEKLNVNLYFMFITKPAIGQFEHLSPILHICGRSSWIIINPTHIHVISASYLLHRFTCLCAFYQVRFWALWCVLEAWMITEHSVDAWAVISYRALAHAWSEFNCWLRPHLL